MYEKDFLEGFEEMEIVRTRRGTDSIRISPNRRTFTISKRYMDELGWKKDERVNIRRNGDNFVLIPNKVGIITVHKNSSGGGVITNANMCLQVRAFSHSTDFEGWIANNMLFFKPKKGEE